jgi:hypothetical protein
MNVIKFKSNDKIVREIVVIGWDISYEDNSITIWVFNRIIKGKFNSIDFSTDGYKTVVTIDGFVEEDN